MEQFCSSFPSGGWPVKQLINSEYNSNNSIIIIIKRHFKTLFAVYLFRQI